MPPQASSRLQQRLEDPPFNVDILHLMRAIDQTGARRGHVEECVGGGGEEGVVASVWDQDVLCFEDIARVEKEDMEEEDEEEDEEEEDDEGARKSKKMKTEGGAKGAKGGAGTKDEKDKKEKERLDHRRRAKQVR